jgi:hypothetical protein
MQNVLLTFIRLAVVGLVVFFVYRVLGWILGDSPEHRA